MADDDPHSFIAKNICGIGRGTASEADIRRISENSSESKEFIDNPRVLALKASIFNDGNVEFTTSVGANKSAETSLEVLFVKRKTDYLSPENIWSCVEVQTIHGAPLECLFNVLRGVWCPSLLQGESSNLPPRVQQLLAELEETLNSSVRFETGSSRDASVNINNVADIHDMEDEIRFWQSIMDDRRSPDKNMAKEIVTNLQQLSAYSDLASLEPDAIEDLIEKTLDALNSVWSAEGGENMYPQVRMQHLFGCIGSSLCKYIQQSVGSLQVWDGLSGEVRLRLKSAIRLCDLWTVVPRKLTQTFWSGSSNTWRGSSHEDTYVNAFKNRLNQVLSVLTLSDELYQLLSPDERGSFRIDKLFAPLKSTNPFLYNPYSEPKWAKALKEFELLIDPVESAVATHFKRNTAPLLTSPKLLLREFQKYKNLLERPSIRRSLVSEREVLFSLLNDMIRKFEVSVDRIESGQVFDEEEGSLGNIRGLVSSRVSAVVMLKQIESKLATILSTSVSVLRDVKGYDALATSCENLVHRIRGEINGRFDNWMSEMQDKIDDDDAAFKLQGSLMGWTSDGILTVNFSNELVTFLREVRQLDDLGFDLPKPSSSKSRQKNVVDKAMEAEKYYRYGILLKKTANFFNSIKEQMIDVQEQLLLDSLKTFVSIVSKRDSDVSWGNPAECENYIRTLQDAAEKLSSENRWLRKVHESLASQAISLMGIDLLRQTDTWKTKWRSIKEKMTSVRSKYSETNTKLWVLHWDHQIYKVLEAGYQMGLESLNENLPEIKVEIVFANKNLEFKPPLEQIRQTYYHEVRKFVAIPNSFEGFGNGFVFKKMGAKNSAQLVQVFSKAESLFDKLSAVLRLHLHWIKIGQIDLDEYVQTNIKSPDEFVVNFKGIRVKRKDIDKLPDMERIGCCTISFTTFKSQLEDLLHRFSDTLLITLRRNVLEEFKEVDQFLEFASERLSTRPHTVEEIGNAKRQWKEIDGNKDGIKTQSKFCVDKKKILLQYASGSAVDVGEIISKMTNLDGEGGRWDDFDIALEAFNDMIEEQKEELKGTLEEETVSLNVNIDKFGNRWRQLKPTEAKSWEYSEIQKIFTALEDWKTQFDELHNTANTLVENCAAFGMSKPRFDGLDSLVEDFTETSQSWDLLKTYYDELQVMSEQDWLTFSVNVYALADFATKWADQLKGSKGDSISEHILTSVEKIKKSIPALKYCRGEPFKEDHWTELLQGKLQLGNKVSRENVKVEHFLSRLDILTEPSTLSYVKNLQARALGEVQIREALQELRAWERSAEVSILTQEESGRRLPLIKDWKDLFLEVGDKQSLLSSLKESQFFKAFADQGHALEIKMTTLDVVLTTLNLIQRKWVYLEPIFGRGALPSEEARFKRVDEDFADIMLLFSREPRLFCFADEQLFPQLADKCKTMLDQLERCQKALAEFLEAKRSSMPRFYFIGDDDLLEILGQAKNPSVIQSHLKKLFQGIHKVKFNSDSTQIVAMISSANELVELQSPVQISEKVEDWLEKLSIEMKSTLSILLAQCLQSKSLDWKFPSQVICLAQAIIFTESAEHAIEDGKSAIQDLRESQRKNLQQLTSQDFSSDTLSSLKMKALVLDVVHNIDVVDQLLRKNVRSLSDWQYKKQVRYYFERSSAVVRMSDAQFAYTFEYQGNAPKLVHTPLTDKCYLTLTQGVHMGFGGNPYGPAGTGPYPYP